MCSGQCDITLMITLHTTVSICSDQCDTTLTHVRRYQSLSAGLSGRYINQRNAYLFPYSHSPWTISLAGMRLAKSA